MSETQQCPCVQWVAEIRSLPTGTGIQTPVAHYAMNAETVRGEGRWHWLLIDNRNAADTPNSGRPSAVRSAAVRHFRQRFDHAPECRWGRP